MSRTTKYLQSKLSVESQKGAVCQQCHVTVGFGWWHDQDQAEDLKMSQIWIRRCSSTQAWHYFPLYSTLSHALGMLAVLQWTWLWRSLLLLIDGIKMAHNIDLSFIYCSIAMFVHSVGKQMKVNELGG